MKRLNNPLALVMLFQIVFSIAIWFDIPVFRQVLGFVYLTFIPGYLILLLMKLDKKLDGVEKTVFSVGLSLSFLMLLGLFENEIAPLMGMSKPLSLLPMLITINCSLLFIGYLTRRSFVLSGNVLKIIPKSIAIFLIPIILSILGAFYVNAYGVNTILIIMIVTLGVLFAVAVFLEKICPLRIYPFVVFSFALALLLHGSLISVYINGHDIQLEYYSFKTTLENFHWSSTHVFWWDETYGRFSSMLSVTILPTIYSVFLNMGPEWVFKIVYPLIFAFVPVTLYSLWKSFIGRKKALIASLIFMSQLTFYVELLALTREMIGELFMALLFVVLLSKKLSPAERNICFLIFSISLVVSHYSTAYIFLFFMSSAWILFFIRKKTTEYITLSKVAAFFLITFAWYIYTSQSAAYTSLLTFGNKVYIELGDFFDISSRGKGVLMGLGLAEAPSAWNYLSRGIAYTLQIFMVIGYLALITKKTLTRFNKEYATFSFVSGILLGFCIIVPRFATTLNMERFYHLLLFFLAPLCLVGVETTIAYLLPAVKRKFVSRRKADFYAVVLLCIIVIPYLFFQTNLVYEVVGSKSWSLPLSRYRMEPRILYLDLMYIEEYDVFGAKWLAQHIDIENQTVYADKLAVLGVLTSYGMLYRGYIDIVSNRSRILPGDFIYLCRMNLDSRVVFTRENNFTRIDDFGYIFEDVNTIYSNGECEIVQCVK